MALDPSIIAAIVAAGAATTQSAVGGSLNRKSRELARDLNRENIAYQREANQKAWDQALQMWNMENEYNSPSSQMQRYQQAGLNPNLIYQQENVASDIGAPAPVAPQSSMDEAQIMGQPWFDLSSLASAATTAITNYQAVDLSKQRLAQMRLANEQQQTVNKYLDRKEYLAADKLETEVKSGLLEVSQKQYEQSAQQRLLALQKDTLAIQQQMESIRSSQLGRREKAAQIATLERNLQVLRSTTAYDILSKQYDLILQQERVKGSKLANRLSDLDIRRKILDIALDESLSKMFSAEGAAGFNKAMDILLKLVMRFGKP